MWLNIMASYSLFGIYRVFVFRFVLVEALQA